MINGLHMVAAPAQEIRREVPHSKEAYLKLFAREWAEIHEGKAPEKGFKEKGSLERKEICEDVKLKSQEQGLFLVADGVSTAKGWFASRETARVMYEMLGSELDRGVENNVQEALSHGENPLERITTFVAARMIAAVEQADRRIQATGAMNREFHGSATTLSVAKLMELPDGRGGKLQRLFFTNIGDSRIYIQRNRGKLEQVTRDDSMLEHRVELGEISQDEARRIDQAPDPGQLDSQLQVYARSGRLTNCVGIGRPTERLGVSSIDLQPGDRFVIVSDGVSDQLLTERIGRIVDTYQEDEQAEAALQLEAMQTSWNGRDPRAKGDDISAIVKTIEARGPDRAYLRPQTKHGQTRESLQDTLRNLHLRLEQARQEVHTFQQQLVQLDSLTPRHERLALMIALEKAKGYKATCIYHLEKTRLDIFETKLPPRFVMGDQVKVWREDFDPPSLDRQSWTVVAYDDKSKRYTLQGDDREIKEISRYELEAEDVNNRVFFGELYVAEQSRQRMEQANQAYHQTVERQQSLRDEAAMIEQAEKRQRAIDTANQG